MGFFPFFFLHQVYLQNCFHIFKTHHYRAQCSFLPARGKKKPGLEEFGLVVEDDLVSNLVFYAQSTSTVISG